MTTDKANYMFYQRRLPVSVLYFATSALASFASELVTRLGTAAALLVFAGIIPIWIPLGRWGTWPPVVGSAALILYFLPAYLWQAIVYKKLAFTSLAGVAFTISFLGLLTCTLLISTKRLLAERDRDPARDDP